MTHCMYRNCKKAWDIADLSRYQKPVRLCAKHNIEYHKTANGSADERLFLYRCDIVLDDAVDATVDAVRAIL